MIPLNLYLRPVLPSDLDLFFEHQQDPEACQMAAFTRKNPQDRTAFDQHWDQVLQNPEVRNCTIVFEGEVAGHVASFVLEGEREVTYWLDRKHWGKGLATRALQLFLQDQPGRPVFARAAFDNVGSQRVLEKCGFVKVAEGVYFAEARGQEVPEWIYRLDGPAQFSL